MITIVIPSRNEKFLNKTVEDILLKARGEIEVITVLDGYWEAPVDDPRVRVLHRGTPRGMRNAITSAVNMARGEFILKCDGHVMFDEGFDLKLVEGIGQNKDWVVIPRRKRLDAENWCLKDVGKADIDYEYLSFPDNPGDFGGKGLNGRIWTERAVNRAKWKIDDNMSFQGSCWFMPKSYFYELELMDEVNYGTFWNEAQEIGLKCWLSGGRVVTNKRTWYAHLHKGKDMGRGYHLDKRQLDKGASWTRLWITKFPHWHKQKYSLDWLIKRFSPLPGWPADWEEQLKNFKNENN